MLNLPLCWSAALRQCHLGRGVLFTPNREEMVGGVEGEIPTNDVSLCYAD